MAQNKKSFVVYTSWNTFLEDLNNEQLGTWFRWVLDYTNDLKDLLRIPYYSKVDYKHLWLLLLHRFPLIFG